ncbi:MAG: riboflavin synthase [Bdellovibrionales bacterium]|nr:riboflavin synthase [Bdellovibrionales bacterium]
MFSGRVETKASILSVSLRKGVLQLVMERPPLFTDLAIGDSVAINGICLTIEQITETTMMFALGEETLSVTGWSENFLSSRPFLFNLERSLKLGDRIHGHLVTGHVDAMGWVQKKEVQGEGLQLEIGFPKELKPFLWKKGSVTVNGVSLTVHHLKVIQGLVTQSQDDEQNSFIVGLIPETLRITNLGTLFLGDSVTLEVDFWSRGLVHLTQNMGTVPRGHHNLEIFGEIK